MLEKIKFLGNVGAFESVGSGATLPLGPLTLIYAENGRGKTTLAAVLRSLATGHGTPISERRRLGADEPPKAVIGISGGADAVFDGGGWHVDPLGALKIFDDQFVATNVCSGLEVHSAHRQGLHELILGERGFELNRKIQLAARQIDRHHADLGKHADAIRSVVPPDIAASLSSTQAVEVFCALPLRDDIEDALEEQRQLLTTADGATEIRRRTALEEFALPAFDPEALSQLLQRSLDDLDADAEKRTKEHVNRLGHGGEQWLNQGVAYVAADSVPVICPFCAQDLDGSSVFEHYRLYFGDEYRNLRDAVSRYSRELSTEHSNEVQIEFERRVTRVTEGTQFWSRFCEIGQVQVNAPTVVAAWSNARDKIVARLDAKAAAPLEALELGEDALDAVARYMSLRRTCLATNSTIKEANLEIEAVKEKAEAINRATIQAQIESLTRTKERQSATVADACDAYKAESEALAKTVERREAAKHQLEEYRKAVFPDAQQRLNARLERFGTGFRISNFESRDTRGGPTSTYALEVAGESVPVRSEGTPAGEHSFGNTLSAGDRNALALAFFLDDIEHHDDARDLIVVLDDPVSSLDDHRRAVTVEDIRSLVTSVKQVVVLSHSTQLLCEVWNQLRVADRETSTTIQIVRKGNGSSLAQWNIEDSLREEHDRRYQRFVKFLDSDEGDALGIARDLREHVERFLRVAFPGEFPPENELKHFMDRCVEALKTESPILLQNRLDELRQIVNYAKKFHHDAKGQPRTPEINRTELRAYTKRVLEFARAP